MMALLIGFIIASMVIGGFYLGYRIGRHDERFNRALAGHQLKVDDVDLILDRIRKQKGNSLLTNIDRVAIKSQLAQDGLL